MMPQKFNLRTVLYFLIILFLSGCDVHPYPLNGQCPWPLTTKPESRKTFCQCLNKHKEVDIADYKETYKAFKCNRHIRQEANQTATGKAINHRQWLHKNQRSPTIQRGTEKAKQVKDRDAKPVIDTVWDIANLAYDGGKALYALAKDDKALLDEALTDLVSDAVATAIPGIPAGTTKIARQAAKKIKTGQKLSQRESKALEKVVEVKKSQKTAEYTKLQANPSKKISNTHHTYSGKTANQLNQKIKTGKAPQGLGRVDTGKIKGEKMHIVVTDKNGKKHALNIDGTWKHGGTKLNRKQRNWLKENGFKIP